MDYYSYRNKYNENAKRPYYQSKLNIRKKGKKDLDALIIDGNTVYEVDDECMKKNMKSCVIKNKKNRT